MTSQRFSNKLSSKFDFKESFKAYIIPSLVLILMMINNVVTVFTNIVNSGSGMIKNCNFFGNLIEKGYVKCYFNNDDFGEGFIIGLCFVGFLFALSVFTPFMRKRNNNFYYSTPITRNNLFKNRVVSSIITMASILFVGVFVITIFNLIASNKTAFVLKWALAYYSECLVYMLSTFAIFSLAMVLSYTIIEAIIFGVGLYMLPTGLSLAFDLYYDSFLNTYTREPFYSEFMWDRVDRAFSNISLLRESSLFNPMVLGTELENRELYKNIITQSNFEGLAKLEQPSIYYVLPLIVWSVLIVGFIVFAKIAFNKRRVENAGMHASNKFVNAFMATEAGVAASSLTASALCDKSKAFVVIASVIAFAIGFAFFYSISIRKIKHTKKAFSYVGAVTIALAIFLGVLSTGGFGYDSYVPNAEDVEMVSLAGDLTVDGSVNYESSTHDVLPLEISYAATGMGIFTDENDIKAVTEIVKNFNNKTDKMVTANEFVVYQLKNGKRVYRSYEKMDSDVKKSILSLTDTKEYKDTQKYILTGKNPTKFDYNLAKYKLNGNIYFDMILDVNYDESYDYREYNAFYANLLFKEASAKVQTIMGNESIKINNTEELRNAIAEDYYNASYEDIYFARERAVCYVGFCNYDETLSSGFYIYPSMKNTIAYLNSFGALDKLEKLNHIDVIEGAYVANYGSEIKVPYNFGLNPEGIFNGGTFVEDVFAGDDYYEYSVDKIFANAKFIEDKAEIEKIIANSTTYKYITYDDTVVLLKVNKDEYIPLVMLNN